MSDIQLQDLVDTDRLMVLYYQAIQAKLAHDSEQGLDVFLGLAERARSKGRRPGGLFIWLLRNGKEDRITIANEIDASKRKREWRYGPDERPRRPYVNADERNLSPDEQFVEDCIHVARLERIRDPFHIARHLKSWDRSTWDDAYLRYQTAQARHWYAQSAG